jgi:RimJ/RimL family protein N-acetyltransferase
MPRADDGPAVFAAYASDPEATRYLAWRAYERIEPLTVFLRETISHWEKGTGPFMWLLCLKGTDAPIGSIGMHLDGGKAMFGYVLAKKFWGHGFATEALTHLVNWSLAQPAIFRAWAFCDVANPASARVMEKAGLLREGVLRRWHVAPNLGSEPRDCIVCAKVK